MTRRRTIAACLCLAALSAAAWAAQSPKPGKVVTCTYRSDLDNTDQPYSLWLPRNYTPDKKWPLVIDLHGLGGSHRVGGVRREIQDCVVAFADGRGNTDYKLWGELDVVRVVHEAKKRFSIDPDRVYLYGVSMGGSGSWQVGVHFPDLFAALGPICGNADHRVWEREWAWGEKHPTWMSPRKAWVEATESAAFFAENLVNLPSWPIHGDKDNVVPCGHSRSMAAELEKAGAECHYVEVPGAGHGVPGDKIAEMLEWVKKQRRTAWPKRVVFKTAWRRHPGAYWVRLHRFLRPFAFARIEAVATDKTSVDVKTDNLEEFSLHVAPPLFDPAKPVRVRVDGAPHVEAAVPADGWVRLRRTDGAWSPSQEPKTLHKTPDLEGPIQHAFMSSFIIVYGDSGKDERAKRVAREEAHILAGRWNRWARGKCRVKPDRDVKPADIESANLILVGDPAVNTLVPRVMDGLPIRIDGHAIVSGDKRFEGDDLGIKLVFPNPLNPKRYVALFSGTTWRGVYQIVGRFGNWFDWGILDGWHWYDFAVFDDQTYSPETYLAVGYFDNDWKLNPEWTVLGDEKLRAARPPRKTPALRQPPAGAGELYLSDLEPAFARPEKGVVARDRSFNAYPLTLGGRTFERGLGVHPNCDLGFDLGGRFPTFEAVVGSDLEGEESVAEARDLVESFEFMVIGDGRMIYQTGRMRWDSEPRHIYVPIPGVRRLELKIHRRSGPRWLGGPVDWAIARVGEPIHNSEAVVAKAQGPANLVAEQPLDGAWELAGFGVGAGITSDAHRAAAEARKGALKADVPGSVYAALAAAGTSPESLPDAVNREWWFWREFDTPREWAGRSVWLECDGAAYQTDCWLNGRWIGRSLGPYVRSSFNATQGVKLGGRNTVAVRVTSSPAEWAKGGSAFRPEPASRLITSQGLARHGTPPLGIWRSVRLKTAGPLRLRSLHAEAAPLAEPGATVRVVAEVQNLVADKLKARLKGTLAVEGNDETKTAIDKAFEVNGHATTRVELTVPYLAGGEAIWRPMGVAHGQQHLHSLAARLELEGGATSDQASVRFHLRRLQLDPKSTAARVWTTDTAGHVPLRGAVWMPADGLLRPDPARTRRLLEQARACGFNTLRVWGGGLAESDTFYDLCDQMGFFVLQELPLTGDGHRAIAADVLANCAELIRRLRGHPCILAWGIGGAATRGGTAAPQLTARLADLCAELDPTRLIADSPAAGITHLWSTATDPKTHRTVWMGASIRYTDGVPAPSTSATLFAGRPEPGGSPDPDAMPLARAAALFGHSPSARDHILRAQLVQADAVRRRAERQLIEPVSEVFWQLNEPFPSVSPALIDAAGRPKPAFHFLRRAQAATRVFADFGDEAPAELAPGGRLWGEVCVQAEGKLQAAIASATILDTSLRRLVGWTARFDAPAGLLARPLVFDWTADPSVAGDVCFLHLGLHDTEGRSLASNLYWFAIRRPARPPCLRVAWLTAEPKGLLADPTFLADAGIEVVRPEADLEALADLPDEAEDIDEEQIATGLAKQLEGADAIVVDAATVFTTYTDEDLKAVADAVSRGCGLLVEGIADDVLDSSLAPALPVGAAGSVVTGIARRPVPMQPGHPALQELAFATAPRLARRPATPLAGGAALLVALDADHPLLVEGAHGKGRVLAFTRPSHTELAAWTDLPRLLARTLGYLAHRPYHEFALRAAAARPTPLAPLARLAPAHVDATLRQDGEAATLQLTNTSQALAFMVHVEAVLPDAQGRAAPLDLSDNYVALLPGEARTLRIQAAPTPDLDGKPIQLTLRGWNLVPRRLKTRLESRQGKLRVR